MKTATMDGNTAAAYVSYAFCEIAFIYPITPSSPMAELADEWSANGKVNLFNQVPKIIPMQSESGVAGAMHGSLTCGSLATTYTCSQGLLLMQPNMYKIAGELLPTVFHVSARALSTHALSIFGDHQDVMACRQTGFAMLFSSSVQEVMDMSILAHLSTLKTSVPFLHAFDGFRTSHEICKIQIPEYEEILSLLDTSDIEKFKARALTSKAPIQRGTAQNSDVYFQNREAANPYYLDTPALVQERMDAFAALTGRTYHLFDYFGAKNAEYVAVIMGSGANVMEETVEKMCSEGSKVGVIKVRLYRPFDSRAFCNAIPRTCKHLAVLDRTKEAGSLGEPLYLDVLAALTEHNFSSIRVFGGRYGLASKEFTPSACYAVFENLFSPNPKNHFTVGIHDDVTFTSLPLTNRYVSEPNDCIDCKFYGLGSDGTVGANKNSIKIIGDYTPLYVQAYFYYDSKKSGGVTVSHLRFGKTPIRSSYLIENANFIACHNPSYLTRYDMLSSLKDNGTFLLNCPWDSMEELERNLPIPIKRALAERNASFYVIDATKISNEVGLGGRTSTIMQAVFFLLNPSILPYEKAVGILKDSLKKKFEKKGERVVEMNVTAIDKAQSAVQKIEYPSNWKNAKDGKDMLVGDENEYYQSFIKPILSLQGDSLPVSAFQADGSVPTGTTKYEKHGVPYLLPKWIAENCIQCNQCSFVCPHACIRPFVIDEKENTPNGFTTLATVGLPETRFKIQVSPHDCMGCGLCADVCPSKEKALVMQPSNTLMPTESDNWAFAQNVKKLNHQLFKPNIVKNSQFQTPLFEFSYACSGCGETAYIKLLTQLFGNNMLIANATGCSSIYGGSAPTCPYTVNEQGRGPAWANSLFEDNAEFGLGMKLAYNVKKDENQSVWIIGGDGWAYDIGYGGLDHVLSLRENVNVLVLDSEVYSNTGGQVSKATPLGAVARFASNGKRLKKKDLGLMAINYGYVYVAQISLGANKQQVLNAFLEAERYDGPSLIIAYSPCIAHGVSMSKSLEEQTLAVESGYWPLYRYNPDLEKPTLTIDSKAPSVALTDFLLRENRFAVLQKQNPALAEELFTQMKKENERKLAFLTNLSEFLKTH